MYKDIFRKQTLSRKVRALLFFVGAGIIIVTITLAAVILWQRPIVIVRIGDFSLNTQVEEFDVREKNEHPQLFALVPNTYGSLNIKIQNVGRRPARGFSLSFLPQGCRLGEASVYKTNTDCAVQITSSPETFWHCVDIRELRPGSEIQVKYKIYQEGSQGSSFQFSKITSQNARVKVIYYRQ